MHAAKTQRAAANMQQLSWDDLRVFVALSAGGSTRRAARELGIDATTVGRRLKALEDTLGSKLFERQPEGMRLTSAGKEVARLATELRERVQSLQQRFTGLDQRISGTVRVTAAEIMGPLVCEALREIGERYPELCIELSVTDAMLNVQHDTAELALRVAEAVPEGLIGRRIAQSAVGIYASRDYVQRWGEDLRSARHTWLEWPKALQHKPAFKWVEERFPERHVVLRAKSANTVLQATRAGLGVAPLACTQAFDDPRLVMLKRLPTTCSTPVWLLVHPDSRDSARVRVVMDILVAALTARRRCIEGAVE
ncbi:MAG TPA: LysR family transcriptional regulator [Polyangiaceae bacterium]|nr:LysR family transcriptional regulator [Polyangiaceae bacterium]